MISYFVILPVSRKRSFKSADSEYSNDTDVPDVMAMTKAETMTMINDDGQDKIMMAICLMIIMMTMLMMVCIANIR